MSPNAPTFWFAPDDTVSTPVSAPANCLSGLDQWLRDDHPAESLLIVDLGADFNKELNECDTLLNKLESFEGTVIVLARSKQLGNRFATPDNIFEVPSLDEEDAIDLLRHRLASAAFENSSYEHLVEIVHFALCIPRAIIQIASVISSCGMHLHQFIEIYQQSDEVKLQLFGTLDPVWEISEAESVVGTGLFNVKHLQAAYEPAAKVFYQLFVLGGVSVPRSLFAALMDSLELVIVITILKGHFLVSEDRDGDTLSIQPLIYLAMKKQLQESEVLFPEAMRWKSEIFHVFSKHYPDGEVEDIEWWRNCFANAFAKLDLEEDESRLSMAAIYDKESKCLYKEGNYRDALAKASDTEGALPSPIPVESMPIIQHHCVLLELLGKYHEVREKIHSYSDEQLDPLWKARFEASLLITEGVYGPALEKYRSIKTATEAASSSPAELYRSIIDYAYALFLNGKVQEAEAEGRNAYQGLRSHLGAEHHDTLSSARKLAQILKGCGKYSEALEYVEEAERGFDGLCGNYQMCLAHVWLCKAQILLAIAVTGREYEDVEVLVAKAAAKFRSCLGDSHPVSYSFHAL